MHKAQLSCVSIKQIGDVFHVNASVRVPKTALVGDKKALKKNLKKLEKESKGKLKEEKAEAPNRL